MKPNWKHDCDKCELVAITNIGGEKLDWYVHDYADETFSGAWESLVVRYGDDGPEYYSAVRHHPRLGRIAEAIYVEHMIAKRKGRKA